MTEKGEVLFSSWVVCILGQKGGAFQGCRDELYSKPPLTESLKTRGRKLGKNSTPSQKKNHPHALAFLWPSRKYTT